MRELARRIGRPLVIVDCPHRRCLRMLETGEADLGIGLQRSPERETYLHFLRTPYRSSAADRVFYVRTGEAARIAQYEDLYKLRVAVAAGAGYFDRFDADPRIRRDVGPNNAVNLRKLMLHRVDTVIVPADQGAVTSKELGLEAQVEPARFRVSDPTPRSVAVSRRAAEAEAGLLNRLEQAMATLRSDGTLAALYDRHFYKRYGVTPQQVSLD